MRPGRGSRRKMGIAGTLLTVCLAFSQISCGTILYPERRGQPAGRLDVGVVAMNGVGLLLFFVPGVIAFVVDFSTGAIYLPPEYPHVVPLAATDLQKVPIEPAELTPLRVEAIVLKETGKTVSLRPGAYQARRLQKLDEFTPEALAEMQSASSATRVIFRANDD